MSIEKRLKDLIEFVKCPETGSAHYGEWGILTKNQRVYLDKLARDCLILINELESENERLIAEKQKVIEYMKTDNYAKLKKEDMYWGYQMGIGMLEHEIDRQKDRIADLEKENAKLLDSVETVQSNRCVYKCELTKIQLKQFAERLKDKCNDKNAFICSNSITATEIDETLKEFI